MTGLLMRNAIEPQSNSCPPSHDATPRHAMPHNHTIPRLTCLVFHTSIHSTPLGFSLFLFFFFPALHVGATNKNVPECPNASLVFGRDMGENHPLELSPDLHEHIGYMLEHTEERPKCTKNSFCGWNHLVPRSQGLREDAGCF